MNQPKPALRRPCRLCHAIDLPVLPDGGEAPHTCPHHGRPCVGPMLGSECPDCWEAHRGPQAPGWTPLDLARPTYHLRCLARGMAPVDDPRRAAALRVPLGTLVPVLTLPEAADLLGLAGMSSVHTQERREDGRRKDGAAAGSCTLATLLTTAEAYGVELEIRVRPKR